MKMSIEGVPPNNGDAADGCGCLVGCAHEALGWRAGVVIVAHFAVDPAVLCGR
jgi:hypothetical protein